VETSTLTARQMYEALKARPDRRRFGFGRKPALVNVDIQNAYTRPSEFPTAYETNPHQIEHVNRLARLLRGHGCPVIWTFVAYLDSGEDCGVWGTRADMSQTLRSIKADDRRAQLDDRCEVDRDRDIVMNKRMASAFFETNLGSLLTFHQVDTVIVTGGSTSGCVRATVVDGLSRSFRMIVPEECVADKHESPHFANLYDMMAKYADVLPVAEVVDFLERYAPPSS
jgi:maleamate amidohydrolase